MAIDDGRRPEPPEPQAAPLGSDDGLTGNEFGRPPPPGEDGPGGAEREHAADVDAPGPAAPA